MATTDTTRIEFVTRIWCEVLESRTATPDDDFFLSGGHSFMVLELIERLTHEASVDIPVARFFADPTLRYVLSHVDGSDS